MIENLSTAVHVLISLSVDEMLLQGYMNFTTNFSESYQTNLGSNTARNNKTCMRLLDRAKRKS